MYLLISGGGLLKQGSSQSQCLLTAGECPADSRQVKVLAEIPLPPPRTKLSYQRDVHGCSKDETVQKVRHLRPYQTTEAQIFSVNPSAAPIKASFQSHLSHFPIKQSETPHPVLDTERRLPWCRSVGGGGVMSSLPLGRISLIKIKQYGPE